tara:strand:+ start:1079 stop:1519 length:441 start_codon:yes stop_codon:yes gene_type:complete
MNESNDQNEKTYLDGTVEFLVPFTKTLVDLLSSSTIKEWVLLRELKNLHIQNVSLSSGTINTTTEVKDFSVSILYVGVRNFILTIRGINQYDGFCIIVTNKGIVINDNSADSPTEEAKLLKKSFLNNYKSPYLITDTFLKFRNQGA